MKKSRKANKALFPVDKTKRKQSKKCKISSLCNSSGLFSLIETEEDEPSVDTQNIRKLQLNDFAVVKVQGKTKDSMRLYVSKILRIFDDGYDVLFFKRISQTQRFSETKVDAFIELHDIFMKLSKPFKSTDRFPNTITFSNDFSGLTIY